MTKAQVDAVDCPVQIIVVDAEDDIPSLSAIRPDGSRWSGSWVVVRSAGVVVGVREVAFDGRDVVSAAELRSLVTAATRDVPPRELLPVADGDLPSISVVVPSDLRRTDQLRTALAALDGLDYPDFEVLLVDNHRDDQAEDPLPGIVDGLDRVRVVREPIPGISAARNAGIESARGDVVAFTDDDVRVDPQWLRALGTRFALRPDEDAVTGLILPAELETIAQLWFERHYGGFGGTRSFAPLTYRGAEPTDPIARRTKVSVRDWSGHEVRTFTLYGAGVAGAGANMAFRIDALRRAGGFDVALGTGTPARGGEDLAMIISLLWEGGAIGYEPAALVWHTHRADYPSLRTQIQGYGLGFTATLSSLIRADPRHGLGLVLLAPAVLRAMLPRKGLQREGAGGTRPSPAVGPPAPSELTWLAHRGGLRGPGAYLRSRREARRRTGRPRW